MLLSLACQRCVTFPHLERTIKRTAKEMQHLPGGTFSRERDCLQALLFALRDHYPSVFGKFQRLKSCRELLAGPVTGKIIKLRRIALAGLSRCL